MSTKKTTAKKVTTGAKTAKTSAPMDARVKTETKPAAKVEAVVMSTPAPVAKTEIVAVVETAPMKMVSKNEVDALVREAAFLFAKRRNFRNGTPTQDWFAAEALVSERLTARGYTVSA